MNVEHEEALTPEEMRAQEEAMEEHERALHEAMDEVNEEEEGGTPEQEAELQEQLPEIEEDAEARAQEAFSKKLDEERMKALADVAHGLKAAVEVEGEEVDPGVVKPLLEKVIREAYGVSLADFMESQRPSKVEWLMPLNAAATELGIWAGKKVFDVGEPSPDLTTAKKTSVKLRHMANGVKAALLLVPGLGTEAAIAMHGGEAVLRGAANSAEKIDEMEGPSSYDVAKEMTMGILPKDEQGNIDKEKAAQWLSAVGSGMKNEQVLSKVPESARGSVAGIAAKLESDPQTLMKNMESFDKALAAKRAA